MDTKARSNDLRPVRTPEKMIAAVQWLGLYQHLTRHLTQFDRRDQIAKLGLGKYFNPNTITMSYAETTR